MADDQSWASEDIEQVLNDFHGYDPSDDSPGKYRDAADYIGSRLMRLGYRKD